MPTSTTTILDDLSGYPQSLRNMCSWYEEKKDIIKLLYHMVIDGYIEIFKESQGEKIILLPWQIQQWIIQSESNTMDENQLEEYYVGLKD